MEVDTSVSLNFEHAIAIDGVKLDLKQMVHGLKGILSGDQEILQNRTITAALVHLDAVEFVPNAFVPWNTYRLVPGPRAGEVMAQLDAASEKAVENAKRIAEVVVPAVNSLGGSDTAPATSAPAPRA